MDTILFNLGSTYSYVYVKFTLGLDMVCDMVEIPVYVTILIGDTIIVTPV